MKERKNGIDKQHENTERNVQKAIHMFMKNYKCQKNTEISNRSLLWIEDGRKATRKSIFKI